MADDTKRTYDDFQQSLHVYRGLKVLKSSTPEGLAKLIGKIKVPIKVWAFVADSGQHIAYVSGNFKIRSTANGS